MTYEREVEFRNKGALRRYYGKVFGGFFLVSFVSAVLFSVLFGAAFDTETNERMSTKEAVVEAYENKIPDDFLLPVRVSIPSVNIDFSIVNPAWSDNATLDAALMEGVVRYPGSGTLTGDTPMFLFGHSSHLPTVRNKAFQAFNNLEKVKAGDLISVFDEHNEYWYRARSVVLENADEVRIEFLGEVGGRKTLILSTCNNFGEKEERFIVEADFIGVYPLESTI